MSASLEFYGKLSKIFCGDEEDFFEYKSGPQLVSFFNTYFCYNDTYGQVFDTRWRYVNQKLLDFSSTGRIDEFLNIILSKNYILTERKISEVDALKYQQKILGALNKICSVYGLIISKRDNRFFLLKIDEDLVEIGKGGFAVIYLQKSTGLVMKKLNDDAIKRSSLRSRLKREFEITKSCSEIESIIKVYDFDDSNCSYTMEKADFTLTNFIEESDLPEDSKINIIRQILHTVSIVHQKDILHRDLSPTNIFFVGGVIKIADFGLGKSLNVLTSHQTMDTASFGQLFYCAPEQLTLLKDADKRSDVYSLGRIINFIMTKDLNTYSHSFRSISEKATNLNPEYRYQDATEMLNALNKWVTVRNNKDFKNVMWSKISQEIFDSDVENYIYEMSGDELCKNCIKKGHFFLNCLIQFMLIDDSHANNVIQLIDSNFEEQLKRYEDVDPFATLAYMILKENFSYIVNEVAAKILNYVAYNVGRFDAQRKIDSLIEYGLEPMIEELLIKE
ncbi:serine/threonine-protein kinase [Streptococcus macacae]|uniref:Kinase domain protein n=1 Tax=Streptococcus macacae NCTC 11558 TaxID=764298 RepID=G5JVG5_9STRE|nr:serine/threonine-protein kinase [Streptococcus macacae]EHJ52556.1 kinase domain protein [Streptococcus macacae NCTC 11558]SUN78561.1 protein kinase [Streptococcus macacae NCTC 11558]